MLSGMAILPISWRKAARARMGKYGSGTGMDLADRKSTRLNSSHDQISYAVFCLKKKNTVGKRNFSTPHPHFSFRVLLPYLSAPRRVAALLWVWASPLSVQTCARVLFEPQAAARFVS